MKKLIGMIAIAALAIMANAAQTDGIYKGKNGSTITVASGKFGDMDTKFVFASGACTIEYLAIRKDITEKDGSFAVLEDFGYGPVWFFKAKFDGKGKMSTTVYSKFATENFCEYGDEKKFTGTYSKVAR